MCGRYTLVTPAAEVAEIFDLDKTPELVPRYNIAPTQPVAVIRAKADGSGRELALMHWGLIPRWAKDPSIGSRMINARSETVTSKPAFKGAFKHRRCLIPLSGFFEWQRVHGRKQPYLIALEPGRRCALAGLWESWQGPNGEEIESCTILTVDANEALRPFHDRMPVILDAKDFDLWLDPQSQDLKRLEALLKPCPADWLTWHPVGTVVNNPRNDDPSCLEPVPEG
jgi:putative SOS response-associated peptidase YedK